MSISFRPGRLQTAPVAKRVLCLSERRRHRRVHAETTWAVTPAGETHQPRQCFPTNTLTVFRQWKLHAQISDAHVLVSASHPAHVEVGFTSQSNTEQLNVVFLPVSYSKQRHWLFNVVQSQAEVTSQILVSACAWITPDCSEDAWWNPAAGVIFCQQQLAVFQQNDNKPN